MNNIERAKQTKEYLNRDKTMNTAKDYFGNELSVGDRVLFHQLEGTLIKYHPHSIENRGEILEVGQFECRFDALDFNNYHVTQELVKVGETFTREQVDNAVRQEVQNILGNMPTADEVINSTHEELMELISEFRTDLELRLRGIGPSNILNTL